MGKDGGWRGYAIQTKDKEDKARGGAKRKREPYRTIHSYNDEGNQTQHKNQLKPTSFTMLNWQQNTK